ncbi:hypothetical protein [Actinoplanes sp. NPDC051494]|uniref:hypothetical protein n=1 Tax=Actinoplanes sp. NPDC051494 TaxID=3363907 RepID=UPI0037BB6A7A
MELPRSAEVMWAFMASAASSVELQDDTESGVTLPGSPEGLGEIQVFIHQDGDVRWASAIEVVEFEAGRRAVTVGMGYELPAYVGLTIDPLGPDSCRVPQDIRIDFPPGSPVAEVRQRREGCQASLRSSVSRLVELAPGLPA